MYKNIYIRPYIQCLCHTYTTTYTVYVYMQLNKGLHLDNAPDTPTNGYESCSSLPIIMVLPFIALSHTWSCLYVRIYIVLPTWSYMYGLAWTYHTKQIE